jgi:hypothetical protein
MRLFFLFTLIAILFSFNTSSKAIVLISSYKVEKTECENTNDSDYGNDSILIENRMYHVFSNPEKKDTFYICVKGKSLTEGKVVFTIISYNGVEILKEEFSSYTLLDYGFNDDYSTKKNKEEYIKKRIKEFFLESNFYAPAINTGERFNEYYSVREIWEEIKSDKTAVGFNYLIGEEDGRKIAYSKKKKRIVMYYNCC